LAWTRVDDTLALRFPSHWVSVLVPFYRLAHSLRRLELQHMAGDETTTLPRLHSLYLSNVDVSEAALHRMLDGCTAFRDLTLLRIHGFRRLVLPFQDPRHRAAHQAPSPDGRALLQLESIVLLYMDLWRVRAITQAAKLREVTLKKLALPIVTVLVLHMKFGDGEELMKAARMLTLFPCLNFLQIWHYTFSLHLKPAWLHCKQQLAVVKPQNISLTSTYSTSQRYRDV
uniref:F-box/LRR-repeat protein 15/At3g58940/PEG3-like LRR domain-containing protein n=1 Tax=Setaria italica TaxID=4555 RepID=K3ZD84_SETIT